MRKERKDMKRCKKIMRKELEIQRREREVEGGNKKYLKKRKRIRACNVVLCLLYCLLY